MGCCPSKNASSTMQPEESTPLLNNDTRVQNGRLPYPRQEPMDAHKEEETLKMIVAQTAANLINISNVHTSDHLAQQDTLDRTSEYRTLLGQLYVNDVNYRQSLHHTPHEGNTIVEEIKGARRLSDETTKWLYDIMDDINAAMQKIEVESVGEIVVPLTFNQSS